MKATAETDLEMRFVEAPEPSPFLAFMSEMEKEMVRQCGVPREMLEKIEQRDGWLRDDAEIQVKAPTECRAPKVKPVKREMTAEERLVIPWLWSQVNYSVGSWDKRFAREIQFVLTTGGGMITEGQSGQVWRIFKRYRRQIVCPDKERLLAIAEEKERCRKKAQEDAKKEPLND
jgi:hypothetical protein